MALFDASKGFWNVLQKLSTTKMFYPMNEKFFDEEVRVTGGSILWEVGDKMEWELDNYIIWDNTPDS